MHNLKRDSKPESNSPRGADAEAYKACFGIYPTDDYSWKVFKLGYVAGSKGDAVVKVTPSAGRVLSQKFPDTDIPGILRDIAVELEK